MTPHPAPTEAPPLSLHDALPISKAAGGSSPCSSASSAARSGPASASARSVGAIPPARRTSSGSFSRARSWASALLRSEEHTSELQSHVNLVCRLLLEKKKDTMQL